MPRSPSTPVTLFSPSKINKHLIDLLVVQLQSMSTRLIGATALRRSTRWSFAKIYEYLFRISKAPHTDYLNNHITVTALHGSNTALWSCLNWVIHRYMCEGYPSSPVVLHYRRLELLVAIWYECACHSETSLACYLRWHRRLIGDIIYCSR